jgi:dihydrofolate reductase
MSRITLSMFMSLNGVIEAPEEWQGPFWNDKMEELSFELLCATDALLLGRVTYELFAEAWPVNTDEIGFSDRMNSLPKFVASKSLDAVEWNSTLIQGDVVEELAAMKRGSGPDMLVYGSSDLSSTLIEHDLIDDYKIWVHPVIVGTGKRFAEEKITSKSLRLVDTKVFDTGVVVLSYQR